MAYLLCIGSSAVIETSLLAARSIQDMILTSYNGVIRVFPAAPGVWRNMTFHNLRAEGAFLVSAKRENGAMQFVRLESLAGEPCNIKTGMNGDIKAHGNRRFNVTDTGDGVVRIDLNKNEWVVLYTGSLPNLNIAPVPVIDYTNYWGTISVDQKQIEEYNE